VTYDIVAVALSPGHQLSSWTADSRRRRAGLVPKSDCLVWLDAAVALFLSAPLRVVDILLR